MIGSSFAMGFNTGLMNNAVHGVHTNNTNLMNAALNPISFGSEADMRGYEKNLQVSNSNNNLMYKAAIAQEPALKKQRDKNIEATFGTLGPKTGQNLDVTG